MLLFFLRCKRVVMFVIDWGNRKEQRLAQSTTQGTENRHIFSNVHSLSTFLARFSNSSWSLEIKSLLNVCNTHCFQMKRLDWVRKKNMMPLSIIVVINLWGGWQRCLRCFVFVTFGSLAMGRQSLVRPLPSADIAEHKASYTWALRGLCQQSVWNGVTVHLTI
jgi:hypothetical protein